MALQALIVAMLFSGCEEDLPCEENLSVVQARHVGDYRFYKHWTQSFCIEDCYHEGTYDGSITCLQNPEKVIINYGYEEECYIWLDSTVFATHGHTGTVRKVGRFHGDSVSLAIHIGGLGGYTLFITGVRR